MGCQQVEVAQEEKKESARKEEHSHEHSHSHDEATMQIYKGYFEDAQVQERSLQDWEGDWQSVYPYLQDGTLDEVFTYKVEQGGDKTFEEYKDYYAIGYQTTVGRIAIKGNEVTFFNEGQELRGTYQNDGYEILTYEAGNRGVRYSFKLDEAKEGLPQYIQFSDHNIYPTKSGHYHLYWGDNRETLLQEVEHWPTYYPIQMTGHDIVHEMIAH
ncbi:metal-binding protein ZinT [Lysinibacillus piscis]